MGDDEYDFAFVGQGNKFGLNKGRRNVSFGHGGVFSQRESSWDFRHHNDSDGELGTIKLKIPYFQGKNWSRGIHRVGKQGWLDLWLSSLHIT